MIARRSFLAACALALVACGGKDDPPATRGPDHPGTPARPARPAPPRDPAEVLASVEGADRATRDAAVEDLASRGEAVVPALIAGLDTSHPDVRLVALAALARLGPAGGSARAAIIGLLDGAAETAIRVEAARTLAAVGPAEEVRAPLLRALGSEDAAVRVEAATALSRLPEDTTTVTALSARLEDDHPDVRMMSAQALGELRAPTSAPALRGALDDGEDHVRVAAARALLAIDPTDGSAIDVLVALLGNQDPQMRLISVSVLASVDPLPGAAREHLTRMARDDPDDTVRTAADAALQ